MNNAWDILYRQVASDWIKPVLSDPNGITALFGYAHRNVHRFGEIYDRWNNNNENVISQIPTTNDFTANILLLLIRDGADGNRDAIDTLRTIFRITSRNDYNWIKRFSEIHIKDLYDYVGPPKDEDDTSDIDSLLYLLCMAKIIGIKMDEQGEIKTFLSWLKKTTQEEREQAKQDLMEDYHHWSSTKDQFSEDAMASSADVDFYHAVFDVGHYIQMLYEDMELFADMEDLLELLRKDGNTPTTSARAYIEESEYEATPQLLSAITALLIFLRQSYVAYLSIRTDASYVMHLLGNEASPEQTTGAVLKKIPLMGSEADMQAHIEKLRKENADLKNKLLSEKGKNTSFHEEVDTLRKQTEAHSALVDEQKKKVEEKDRELEALRRALLKKEENEEKRSEEEMISLLSAKKICLIGGDENWLKKVRAIFPGWRYIGTSGLQTRDISSLKNMDCVYVFYGHLDHKTYCRVMQMLRPIGVRIGYVSSVNLQQSLEQFCTAFEEEIE